MTNQPAREAKLDELVFEIDSLQKKRSQALRALLDEQLNGGKLVALTSRMGVSDSYIITASLQWIANNLKLFISLPLMRNKIDPTKGTLIIDQDSVQQLQQRCPDMSRQPLMAYYLLRNIKRKFPTILVVVSEAWVDDPNAPEWASSRATRSSISIEDVDTNGRLVFLDLSGSSHKYIIDGQHRWLGIDGLMQIIIKGQLDLRKVDGSATGKTITRASLQERFNLTDADITGIENETMGVELIPAVMIGETREDAQRRIRSIFVSVNKTAQPLSAGELATLDDDDGFSVIARQVALTHKLFEKDTKKGDRINWKSTAMPAGSHALTGVATLRSMAEHYLEGAAPYTSWKVKPKEVAIRPDDEDLAEGELQFTHLIDGLTALPSFAEVLRGTHPEKFREFSPKGKGHLLFRPLGQLILAEALGFLHMHDSGDRVDLAMLFQKLNKCDKAGGFEHVESPTSVWYGITYDPIRSRMIMQGRETAVRLLKYMLNGPETPKEHALLLNEFQQSRTIKDAVGGDISWNWDGSKVKSAADIQLPPML